MAEELKHLIERIQKEAVDKSEKDAAQIVAQAKEKAAAAVKDAETKAKAGVCQVGPRSSASGRELHTENNFHNPKEEN